MQKPEIKRSMLSTLLPGLRSLAKRGLAGWLVIFGAIITGAIVVMTVISPWISPHDPSAINPQYLLSPPSSQFPLGTDLVGRDMLSRVISGGGVMLQVAVFSVLVCRP
jgi:peptide/nickel transport system permease protein